ASHSRSCGTLPKAFFRSYHTTCSSRRLRLAWSTIVAARKLCSPQPLTERKPFCASACRAFRSSQRVNLRARSPA
ncbi:hypothetical protein PHMEG_00041030, partial [Phytophthora megakarya]